MTADWNWSYPCPPPDGTDFAKRVSQAEAAVRRLSERLDQIERQLEEVKARTPVHVEYHFDQLKVNELKGTLNVGLSPQGVQGIDSFETPQTGASPPAEGGLPVGLSTAINRPIEEIARQMEVYMDTNAPVLLTGMERQLGLDLDHAHRLRLLTDVKRQLKERVHYYARMSAFPSDGTDQERLMWRQAIVDRTERDIQAAFSAYLNGWKQKTEKGQREVQP